MHVVGLGSVVSLGGTGMGVVLGVWGFVSWVFFVFSLGVLLLLLLPPKIKIKTKITTIIKIISLFVSSSGCAQETSTARIP